MEKELDMPIRHCLTNTLILFIIENKLKWMGDKAPKSVFFVPRNL